MPTGVTADLTCMHCGGTPVTEGERGDDSRVICDDCGRDLGITWRQLMARFAECVRAEGQKRAKSASRER